MTSIQLGKSVNDRRIAKVARVMLRNRYFESNPILTEDAVSLIARPGRRLLCNVGAGPIRGLYTSPGNFDDTLFAVSAGDLYRIDIVRTLGPDGWVFTPTPTLIGTISAETSLGSVSFAATAPIGDGPNATPPYLYIADGNILWCYTTNGYAQATLTATGLIANNDVVRIGGTYYKFTTGSVDSGTPVGTSSNPWLVARGAGSPAALTNLYRAVGATGTAGTDYSTALVEGQTDAAQVSATATTMSVRATAIGLLGNGLVTTETGANIAWGSDTATGGGTPGIYQIPTPNDTGVISLAFVKSFIIVVPVQGGDQGEFNGRFYWIEPGANSIDPLNFATAERMPDPIWQVLSYNDKFWFTGEDTIEPWYPTGDTTNTTPMAPFTGMVFNRGALPGTAVQVKDAMIFADPDGGVFSVSGGINRISTPAIEERIRELTQKNTFNEDTGA